ncbi:helix-hairpin-helix domain-containing protein [Methylobacterium oxalidis]|nr:helix-hairpin-helix domain-containing protein [Methylobacterium oxalidis]GJE30745.1 hypothetical protein LDDCCGHA_0914 [Methylobacterium oxalidis]
MLDLNMATAEELDSVAALQGHGFEIVRYREGTGPVHQSATAR